MSKKCKWKKKSNSFSTKEKTNERRRWLLKDSCFFKLLFFFTILFHSFICCLMASDQTVDWIISLTLRLKRKEVEAWRWWSKENDEKKMGEIGPRLVIEMKEGTENWNLYSSANFLTSLLFFFLSLTACLTRLHFTRFEVKMINNFYLLQQCFFGSSCFWNL